MKVTITEAAKLAGLSRSYFHVQYVKTGKITVDRDRNNKPQIDTSELLRVFGSLKHNKQENTSTEHEITLNNSQENTTLRQENAFLREQLAVAQDRERWLQQTVDTLTNQLKLLEHKPGPTRGFFARLFGK